MFGIALIILCVLAFIIGKLNSFKLIWGKKSLQKKTEDRIEGAIVCFGVLIPVVGLVMLFESIFELNLGLWISGFWFPFYFFILPFWLEYKVAAGRY